MKKVQKGFTLIELMIVVAIIGILAAVAIPAYQDYIARAQASEAITLLGGSKTPLAEFYADNGRWPTNVQSVVANTKGTYIHTMDIPNVDNDAGVITVSATFKDTGVNTNLRNASVYLQSEDGGRTWKCGPANSDHERFLPSACREQNLGN